VEEVDFSTDTGDLRSKMSDADRHLIQRLVAFFATGDSIVANNLVLNLYKHINAPEARMYLSRQLYEEALHVQFYLTLLDTYVPDPDERARAFAAVDNIPSIRAKAQFCDEVDRLDPQQGRLETKEDRKKFLLNLVCFASCIEGLFFFGAFAYVYFLRSRGLLHGLAGGTNWVFRDESAHMAFAFEVVKVVREEEPDLFDADLEARIAQMIEEAVACETMFAEDLLSGGVAGLERARHAHLPRVRRRPALRPARHGPALPREEPLRVHGAAGRAGARELLRASRLGLPDRRDRRGLSRLGVLSCGCEADEVR
jgi:ribonucleoside-diphosphate reductase beta chain